MRYALPLLLVFACALPACGPQARALNTSQEVPPPERIDALTPAEEARFVALSEMPPDELSDRQLAELALLTARKGYYSTERVNADAKRGLAGGGIILTSVALAVVVMLYLVSS